MLMGWCVGGGGAGGSADAGLLARCPPASLPAWHTPSLRPIPPPCRAQAEPRVLAGIHRQYGDFLYAKRDYDAAMEQ